MERTLLTPGDDAALEGGIQQMLAEMRVLRAQMERDQRDINRLRVETAELKAQGEQLRDETRKVLSSLRKAA